MLFNSVFTQVAQFKQNPQIFWAALFLILYEVTYIKLRSDSLAR